MIRKNKQTLWMVINTLMRNNVIPLLALLAIVVGFFPSLSFADTGLDFPLSGGTVRFKWTDPHLNGLPIYGPSGRGVTYIWRYYPRQKAGYYTTFFWGNDDGGGDLCTFLWVGNCYSADSYYGMHPYPNPPPSGTAHGWEVSVEQNDFTNGVVAYDQWFTQGVRVWADGSGKHHEFYWNLPNTDSAHRVTRTSPTSWGNTNPPSPALTWGDAPWAPGNEIGSGIHRGIRIYNNLLSIDDMISEASSPLSTAAGSANIWYLNMDPTPTDISDKSGNGHNPVWVGSRRPALYTEGGVPDTQAPTTPTNLSAAAASSSQINLSWTPSTDNIGVTGYRIYRCQGTGCTPTAQLTTVATNSYSDTGLAANTTYVYRVAAHDAAGNISGQSSSASAITETAKIPEAPTNLHVVPIP